MTDNQIVIAEVLVNVVSRNRLDDLNLAESQRRPRTQWAKLRNNNNRVKESG